MQAGQAGKKIESRGRGGRQEGLKKVSSGILQKLCFPCVPRDFAVNIFAFLKRF
jgi:hypothetical protein